MQIRHRPNFQVLGVVWDQAVSLQVCAQALEEQASGCEAGARTSEGREAAASIRADALKQGITQMWERLGCQALGLEELLGDEGITDANLMQHLGIIEQRASQLLQVLRCPGGVTQSLHMESAADKFTTHAAHEVG